MTLVQPLKVFSSINIEFEGRELLNPPLEWIEGKAGEDKEKRDD